MTWFPEGGVGGGEQPQLGTSSGFMGSQCLALAEPTRGGRWSSLIRK